MLIDFGNLIMPKLHDASSKLHEWIKYDYGISSAADPQFQQIHKKLDFARSRFPLK
jgi:hypothetical protein